MNYIKRAKLVVVKELGLALNPAVLDKDDDGNKRNLTVMRELVIGAVSAAGYQ